MVHIKFTTWEKKKPNKAVGYHWKTFFKNGIVMEPQTRRELWKCEALFKMAEEETE